MSKHEKLVQRIFAKPTPADVTWNEMVTLLDGLGYEVFNSKRGGSRRKFVHKETKAVIFAHEPHPQPEVCKALIDDIRQHLTDRGLI